MRQATGQPSWVRRGTALGAVKTLQAVLELSAPPDGDRSAWALAQAREYVDKNHGATLSVFAYQSWVQSGRPEKREGPPWKAKAVEEDDPEERRRRDRRLRLEAERKVDEFVRLEREAKAAAQEGAPPAPPAAAPAPVRVMPWAEARALQEARAAKYFADKADREAKEKAGRTERTPDETQAMRGHLAKRRPQSEPISLAGSKPERREMSQEERESEKQRQVRALAEMTEGETRKAGGT